MGNMKNVVNSRSAQQTTLLVYSVIWMFSVVMFWLFHSSSIALLYSVIVNLVLLPGASFVISFLSGHKDYFGRWKLTTPLVFGIMHGLNWSMTFGLSNTLVTGNINLPNIDQMSISAVLSVIGLIIGIIAKYVKRK